MTDKENMNSFLMSNGFDLVEQEISEYFGDYYETFTNNIFELRFSKSKSFETVDIRSIAEKINWYDLALVKAVLHNEEKLDNITPIEEYYHFLKNEFDDICNLFSDKNYPATKMKLDELGNKRAMQMFPRSS